ncbi:MAG: diguanylate cyclase domain-containing protein [Puniceicoccaceae bacterium]
MPPDEWLRLLLVEDDPLATRTVNIVLKKGFQRKVTTESAQTLEAAIEAATSQQFDVALLDLNLPGTSGLETLDKFLNADTNCPVIVLTGDDSQENGVMAVQRGAQDYLVKGEFNEKVLIRAIRYAKERYRLATTLKRLAVLDDLTDLFNRRGYFSLAVEAYTGAIADKEVPGVLYFDLDGFKEVNDTYGHAMGDWALKVFSDCLRHIFHSGEIVARLGGDEFAVFLPKFDEVVVEDALERLAKETQRICVERDVPFLIQFSHGMSSDEQQKTAGAGLDNLMRAADTALYETKRKRGSKRRKIVPNSSRN